MSGPAVVEVNPDEIFAVVYLVLAIAILLYVARLPTRGRYYLPFMLYSAVSAGFAFIVFYENSGLVTEQQAFHAYQLVGLIGPTMMFALQYNFILNFATDKKSWFQKCTIIGDYVYTLILGSADALGLEDPTIKSYGVLTPTGYTPPNHTAAWLKYTETPFRIFNHNFNIDYLTITLLSLYALLSYYRRTKSPLVSSQIRYLIVGVVLDYFAPLYHGLLVSNSSGGFSSIPDLQTPFYWVTLVVLLTGLTRHQFRKVTPVGETAVGIPQTYGLADGRSYLARDNDSSFAAFGELVRNGREGLCVARIFPDDVRKTYGLQTTPIRGISEEKREDAISATDLLGLSLTVKDFMETAKRPVVLLQGVEYLARVNGFTPVIRLLDGLYEAAGKKNGIILIPVSANALEPREDAILVSETTPQPSPSRS